MTRSIFTLFLLLIGNHLSNAQTTVTLDSTVLTQTDVVTGLNVPWEILWGPDDHIWVTERRGKVIRVNPETGNFNEILDIQSLVESGGEPGLLGMTLHPDFDSSPIVYLVYNFLPTGGFQIKERLVSYEWDGTTLINPTILLDNIDGGGIHNGSRLLISIDGKILMTTGDTGNSGTSQDLESLSGKLLRINLDGSIPSDNPFPNSYVYSYGHRNAQGLCYGPNDILYSSEHGAQQSDEVNFIVNGRNYGWPIVQGACNTTAEINFCNSNVVVEPIAEYSPCQAVNGLDYYNHPAIPELGNSLIMAVLGGLSGGLQRLAVLHLDESGTTVTSEDSYFTNFGRLRDVCINPHNGAFYIATNGGSYPGSGPNRIIEFVNEDWTPADCAISNTILTILCDDNGTPTNPADDTFSFDANIVGNGTAWTANDANTTTGTYDNVSAFGPYAIADGNLNFMIVDDEDNGCVTEVSVAAPDACSDTMMNAIISPELEQYIQVSPNPAQQTMVFSFSENFIGSYFELISYNGQTVLREKITATQMSYKTTELQAGLYFIKATNELGTITRTVVVQP